MSNVSRTIKDLVIANRILANLGMVDAFGEISVRHPSDHGRFFLAGPVSPGGVEVPDVIEFKLDGQRVANDDRELPRERFIHAAVYEARSDVKAILHAAPEDILPFGITQTPLRSVIASVGDIGQRVPVWDIAKRFGNATDLAVSNPEQGRDLARTLGKARVALLRGSGFIVTGRTLNDLVRLSAYIPRNGRAIMEATSLGRIKSISAGETAARLAIDPESNAMRRGWEYWARQAGCDELLAD
jgi:ribulose-5-phosphate 4-epimerase/fuculose-1-phosphate aldolase